MSDNVISFQLLER